MPAYQFIPLFCDLGCSSYQFLIPETKTTYTINSDIFNQEEGVHSVLGQIVQTFEPLFELAQEHLALLFRKTLDWSLRDGNHGEPFDNVIDFRVGDLEFFGFHLAILTLLLGPEAFDVLVDPLLGERWPENFVADGFNLL